MCEDHSAAHTCPVPLCVRAAHRCTAAPCCTLLHRCALHRCTLLPRCALQPVPCSAVPSPARCWCVHPLATPFWCSHRGVARYRAGAAQLGPCS